MAKKAKKKDTQPIDPKELRKKQNADIIKRMKEGHSLITATAKALAFPKRQKIEKDEEAIRRLYGDDE